MKIGTICKHCNTYNLVYNKACIECGTELIKFCPKCKSANFPNAANCRKCGYSFKKIKRLTTTITPQITNTPKEIIIPPRQFVLPTIVEQPSPKLRKKSLSSDSIEQMLLDDNRIIKGKPSRKKVTDAPKKSKSTTDKKHKVTKPTENENVLQNQLNSLQSQLSGLQKQLNILPQQLNAMKMQENPIEKESSEILNNRPKSNQQSVLPKSKNPKLKPRVSEKTLKPLTDKSATNKGILPFKANILPNRRNINSINKHLLSKSLNIDEEPLKKEKEKPKEQAPATSNYNIEYTPNLFTQQSAKNVLVNTLLNTDVSIISLSGASGFGKNIVLKSTIEELKENQFVWLVAKSTPLSQITPCGLFQDLLLSFFNVPNFCVNTQKLKKDSTKFFKSEFPNLYPDEIDDLINFLYPEKVSYYEDIFMNKIKTFSILRKVFDTVTSRMQTVFVFDNFEYIDTMSYDFLKTLINTESGLTNAKFILTYTEPRSAKTYLYDKSLTDSAYTDISLVAFNENQIDTFINQYNPLFVGTSQALRAKIHEQTGGNPAYIEQILNLMTDCSRNYISFILPTSFDSVVKNRLEILKQENVLVYELLIAASILGLKFQPVILNQMFKIDDKTFVDLFSSLLHLNFITPVSETAYEFKSTMLWKSILDIARRDKHFLAVNEKLFVILSGLTLSSHSLLAIIATNLKQNLSALNTWSDVVRLTSAIGDENIYIIAQKHSLSLVEKLQGVNSSLIKNNIYERLGKLLSFSNPKEAIIYLPKVIEHSRKMEDNLKEFELTGYLARCCHLIGNQYGVIECIDSAVANVDKSFELEIAVLKSKKINALLIIGNCGEAVNLIDSQIIPILEKYLDTSRTFKNISIEDLFETWLQTYLDLATALVLQGDNRSFGVLDTLFEIIEKNHVSNELFICKTKLVLAMANTFKGEISKSELLLDETLRLYKNNDIMDVTAITTWNMISVINSILRNQFEGLQDELFQVVTFVNNNNDNLNKNILKLLLGKVLKEKGKFKQALAIYSEEIKYFANEKNAIGVLLAWYLISEVTLLTESPAKSLEYSLKALDIAQSPKIQNYYFITQFNKVIGEAYLASQDYESAKVYIESAIGIARQFELHDILTELYFLYGKYLQELATIKSNSQKDYALSALKMYDKATNLSQSLDNRLLTKIIMTAGTELMRYCQKHNINLH